MSFLGMDYVTSHPTIPDLARDTPEPKTTWLNRMCGKREHGPCPHVAKSVEHSTRLPSQPAHNQIVKALTRGPYYPVSFYMYFICLLFILMYDYRIVRGIKVGTSYIFY